MSTWKEKYEEVGGILGLIEKNRGKIGLGVGFGLGYLFREKIPAYIQNLQEKIAKRNVQYTIAAMKELGLVPSAERDERIIKSLDLIAEKLNQINTRVEALETKYKQGQ